MIFKSPPLFFGKVTYRTFIFNPLNDITAYELAQIKIKWFPFTRVIDRTGRAGEKYLRLPKEVRRHIIIGAKKEFSLFPNVMALGKVNESTLDTDS